MRWENEGGAVVAASNNANNLPRPEETENSRSGFDPHPRHDVSTHIDAGSKDRRQASGAIAG